MSSSTFGIGNTSAQYKASQATVQLTIEQKLSKAFDKIDSAGAGKISKSQFTATFNSLKLEGSTPQDAQNLWSKIDPKGTGLASKKEFIAAMSALNPQDALNKTSMKNSKDFSGLFSSIDSSGNGAITKEELTKYFKKMSPQDKANTNISGGIESLWKKLGPKNTGSVSKSSFVAGMQKIQDSHEHRKTGSTDFQTARKSLANFNPLTTETLGNKFSVMG
jgi:Ca2+-binding EF-hand superfamily protein